MPVNIRLQIATSKYNHMNQFNIKNTYLPPCVEEIVLFTENCILDYSNQDMTIENVNPWDD